MTYSALKVMFGAPVVSLWVNEEDGEQFQDMLFFIGCCVKSYPDTIVQFSDWLLCCLFLFLIGG